MTGNLRATADFGKPDVCAIRAASSAKIDRAKHGPRHTSHGALRESTSFLTAAVSSIRCDAEHTRRSKMVGSTDTTEPHTPAELIASAVQTEKEAALFYTMMADLTSDADARKMLLDLADDETSHATTLANLYFEMTGNGITESTTVQPEGEPNLFDFTTASRREALEFALRNESNAADLYQAQAESSDNPRVATIFRLLADTEREHAAYLQLQIDRMDDPDTL
jgi:rubrerythrin